MPFQFCGYAALAGSSEVLRECTGGGANALCCMAGELCGLLLAWRFMDCGERRCGGVGDVCDCVDIWFMRLVGEIAVLDCWLWLGEDVISDGSRALVSANWLRVLRSLKSGGSSWEFRPCAPKLLKRLLPCGSNEAEAVRPSGRLWSR
jgi:hypothetical protein